MIAANAGSTTFTIDTLDDNLVEGSELFNIAIDEVTGGGFELVAAHPTNNNVNTTITDEDTPDPAPQTALVSLSGPDAVIEGQTTGNYTVSVDQTNTEALTVTLATAVWPRTVRTLPA